MPDIHRQIFFAGMLRGHLRVAEGEGLDHRTRHRFACICTQALCDDVDDDCDAVRRRVLRGTVLGSEGARRHCACVSVVVRAVFSIAKKPPWR